MASSDKQEFNAEQQQLDSSSELATTSSTNAREVKDKIDEKVFQHDYQKIDNPSLFELNLDCQLFHATIIAEHLQSKPNWNSIAIEYLEDLEILAIKGERQIRLQESCKVIKTLIIPISAEVIIPGAVLARIAMMTSSALSTGCSCSSSNSNGISETCLSSFLVSSASNGANFDVLLGLLDMHNSIVFYRVSIAKLLK